MSHPCPKCGCRMCDVSETRLHGYIRREPLTRRRRQCRHCKTIFFTREELDETTPLRENNGEVEENDDYKNSRDEILAKLKEGKTETQINQQKICEVEDLEFLEEMGLVRKEIVQTGRRPKTIWSTI